MQIHDKYMLICVNLCKLMLMLTITLHAIFVVVVARLTDALEASDRITTSAVHADARNRLTFILVWKEESQIE